MAVRKNPSLSEILDAFKSAQAKTAGDGVCEACGGAGCPECMPEAMPEEEVCENCGGGGCPDCVGGPEALLDAAQTLAEASGEAEAADAEVVDAAEALKDIADDFINEHTASLRKEAQLFGQLFAASAMAEMNKTAALQDATESAYAIASNALDVSALQKTAAEAYEITMNATGDNMYLEKTAARAIYTEAYRDVMAKLAGFEDADEAEEAMGQELSPEDLAMMAGAEDGEAEDLVEDEDYTYDELAELAAQISEDTGADVEPEDVAAAANLLSEARENDGDIDEDAIAESAYQDALDQMGA